jgi:4-hydroxybenzoate polyprenyltransferase
MAFQGYRTYLVAGVMAALAVAMALGVTVPEEIWALLAAIGLGTLRNAVEATKQEVKDAKAEVKAEVKELK